MLEWRLEAFRRWQEMEEPDWAKVNYPKIDYQDAYYYSAPKSQADKPRAWTKSIRNCSRPMRSWAFRSMNRRCWPASRWMLSSTVSPSSPPSRKSWRRPVSSLPHLRGAALAPGAGKGISRQRCSGDGQLLRSPQRRGLLRRSFVYIPKGVRCPMELSTYFRINERDTGQFERTLIIADKGIQCQLPGRLHRAPMRDENQLHAAVVELVALDDAEIKYSTVQNWYPAMRTARAASSISSPSAAIAAATTRRFPGPRSRPAPR